MILFEKTINARRVRMPGTRQNDSHFAQPAFGAVCATGVTKAMSTLLGVTLVVIGLAI